MKEGASFCISAIIWVGPFLWSLHFGYSSLHEIVWCGSNGLLQAYRQCALGTNVAELDYFYFYPPTLFEGKSPSLSLFSLVSLFFK